MKYASTPRQLGPTGRTVGRGHLPYDTFGLFRRRSSKRFSTSTLRNVLYVTSLGVALYLLVPQLPGLEHSANVLDGSSEPFLMAALAAEITSLVCYSEVLGTRWWLLLGLDLPSNGDAAVVSGPGSCSG